MQWAITTLYILKSACKFNVHFLCPVSHILIHRVLFVISNTLCLWWESSAKYMCLPGWMSCVFIILCTVCVGLQRVQQWHRLCENSWKRFGYRPREPPSCHIYSTTASDTETHRGELALKCTIPQTRHQCSVRNGLNSKKSVHLTLYNI